MTFSGRRAGISALILVVSGIGCWGWSICLRAGGDGLGSSPVVTAAAAAEPDLKHPVAPVPEKSALRARSEWQEADKLRWQRILSLQPPADVLVVPMQDAIGEPRLDVTSRMTMTRMIAQHIQLGSDLRVTSPDLLVRAFGNPARYSQDELSRMMALSRPKRVIIATGSHRNRERMTIRYWAGAPEQAVAAAAKAAGSFRQEDAPVSDSRPPESAFASMTAGVVARLGFEQRREIVPRVYPRAAAAIPDRLPSTNPPGKEPLTETIWQLQFMGALHKGYNRQEQDSLFQRSLAALQLVSSKSDDYRLLKARANYQLGRRPAALEALGQPKDPEQWALHAALSGNLPEAEKWTRKITRPIPRVLAELDSFHMRASYRDTGPEGAKAEAKRISDLVPAAWRPFLIWHVSSYSVWVLVSDADLASAIQQVFPLGEAASSQVAERLKGLPPGIAPVMLPLLHANAVAETRSAEWLSHTTGDRPTPTDLLLLMRSFAEGSAFHHAHFESEVQGNHIAGLQLIEAYEQAGLKDHPWLVLQRARTLQHLQRRTADRGSEQAMANRIRSDGANLHHWDHGQGELASFGRLLECTYRPDGARGTSCPASPYDEDFPPRGVWMGFYVLGVHGSSAPPVREAAGRIAYSYSTTDFSLWKFLFNALRHGKKEAEADLLVKDLTQRFVGSPERLVALIAHARETGDRAAELELHKTSLREDPDGWTGYWNLGLFLLEEGRYGDGARQFLNYPQFKARTVENPVALSNYAFEAASELMGRGSWKEAIPLLQLADGYRDGSSAGMSATMTLRILEQDFSGAQDIALQRVQRYRNENALSEAILLGHLVGQHAQTEAATQPIVSRLNSPKPWIAAALGQRMAGKSDQAVAGWMSKVLDEGSHLAPMHAKEAAISALLLDRPAANLELLWRAQDDLEPSWRKYTPEQKEKIHAFRKKQGGWVRPGAYHPVQQYAQIKSGHYDQAVELAEKHAHAFYAYIAGDSRSPTLLPYLALAMEKKAKGELFHKILDELQGNRGILQLHHAVPERHLARAVLRALNGEHKEALLLLNQARNTLIRPKGALRNQGFFPPEYVLADIAESLYLQTRHEPYRAFALEWVRSVQKTQPWASWAYGIEVMLTSPGSRVEAVAALTVLDRHSERLSRVAPQERAAAEAWLKSNDPFRSAPRRTRPFESPA